ncbi:hypothetical protein Tco_0795254 [Tanacetum coccineum]
MNKEDTRSPRSSKEDGVKRLIQGSMPIVKALESVYCLRKRQEVSNDCRRLQVRLFRMYLLCGKHLYALVGEEKEDDHGVTKGREDVHEVFQQRGSGAKRKLSRCRRNQMGNEPILALPKRADDFVVYYAARSKDLEARLEREKVIACTSRQLKVLMKDCMANVFDFEAKYHLGKENVDVVPWSRKKE